MSALKKKHVINEVLDNDYHISENQQLVKVIAPRGNHLYEICTADGVIFLASMPSKFRNTLWIKGGSFVIIEAINEGKKVKGEIVKVLLKHHLKQMKKDGNWPKQFYEDEILDQMSDLSNDLIQEESN